MTSWFLQRIQEFQAVIREAQQGYAAEATRIEGTRTFGRSADWQDNHRRGHREAGDGLQSLQRRRHGRREEACVMSSRG